MFEYFPGNYIWNLAAAGVLNSGGNIDEFDRACKPLLEAGAHQQKDGSELLFASWSSVVDRLVESADNDASHGRSRSAGAKYRRAANYLGGAERMQSRHWPDRKQAYERTLELFEKGTADRNCTRVEVPFGDTTLPAYFVRAETSETNAPCIIQWNGLDSTKEMLYLTGFADELAARGVSTLMVDTPGTGEALRLQHLTATPETEGWASACVDYLETRSDVDNARIGLVGWSLGGYFAPRAAAFEKRLKLCVAWGANHNWGEMQKRRQAREGENPVPHYWDHVMWVWGAEDIEEFMSVAERVSLVGVLDKITVPFLVTHGESDRQIPVEYAQQSYDEAVNSPKRELRIFTQEEGGCEHVGCDNISLHATFIADWIDETFSDLD